IARLASPFVLTPIAICGVATALISIPWLTERPWLVTAWTALAIAVPIAAELAGVCDRTWWITGKRLEIESAIVGASDPAIVGAALVIANLAFVFVVVAFARATARDRRRAERRL